MYCFALDALLIATHEAHKDLVKIRRNFANSVYLNALFFTNPHDLAHHRFGFAFHG